MDRGVVVGSALICASFLIAVLLNQSETEPTDPIKQELQQLARERNCDEPALQQQKRSEQSEAEVRPEEC